MTVLAQNFSFDGAILARAIRSTFERRRTKLPETKPTAFTDRFAKDATKKSQWKSFLRRSGIGDAEPDFSKLVDQLSAFVLPVLSAIHDGMDFQMHWPVKGPWSV